MQMCDGLCNTSLGHRTSLKKVWTPAIPLVAVGSISREESLYSAQRRLEGERDRIACTSDTSQPQTALCVSWNRQRLIMGLHSACLTRDSMEETGGVGRIQKWGFTGRIYFFQLKKRCRERSPWWIRDNAKRLLQKSARRSKIPYT